MSTVVGPDRVRLGLGNFTAYLAEGLECDGAIIEAFETIELALPINLEERNLFPRYCELAGNYISSLLNPNSPKTTSIILSRSLKRWVRKFGSYAR